jgi:membrane protein implicated in regulation of membrane protease activity
VLLLVLTGTIFENGVTIIRQNAKALGFFALNFDVPLPFLLIGLWSIVVLFLALFSISTLVQIYRVVRPRLRRPERVRRAA